MSVELGFHEVHTSQTFTMHDKHMTVLLGTFTGGLEFQNAQKLNILATV